MEFHIDMKTDTPDPATIEAALCALDPAALLDMDGSTLRVATSLDARALAAVIVAAGYPLEQAQVVQLPSICCGGCSG